jgi:hypothetical protein
VESALPFEEGQKIGQLITGSDQFEAECSAHSEILFERVT